MSMDIKKYATVDQALRARELIAINVSDKQGTQNKGQLVFSISNAKSGNKIDIILPPTWLPQDLTSYASVEDFGDCLELRGLIRNGLIVLIPQSQYEELQKSPEYPRERRRVDQIQSRLAKPLEEESTTYSLNIAGAKKVEPEQVELPEGINISDNKPKISSVRQAIYDRILDMGRSSDLTSLLTFMEEIKPPLTQADYQNIIDSTKDRGNPVYQIAIESISLEKGFAIDLRQLDYVKNNQ